MKKIISSQISFMPDLRLTVDELIELVNNSSVNFDIKKLEKLRKEEDERDERNRPLILRKNRKMSAMLEVRELMNAKFDNVFALLEFLKKERDNDSFGDFADETTQMIRDALDKVINELESFINDQLSQKIVKFNMKTVVSHMTDFYCNMYNSDPDIQVEIDDTRTTKDAFFQQLEEMREKIAVKDELKECA